MRRESQLGAALAYLDAGLCVIPCRPRDKRPALRTWRQYQRIRSTEYECRHWWGDTTDDRYGVAIVCGGVSHNLAVIDCDSMDAYRRWRADQRELAASAPTVATARGRHIYLRTPRPNRTSYPVEHIDIRGEGSYVVAPPSIHPSGKQYRLLSGHWLQIPTVDLQELLTKAKTHTERNSDSCVSYECSRSPAARVCLAAIAERAKGVETPRAGERYTDPAMRLLVALVHCLGEHHGGRSWPLSCRLAGELIGVSYITANRWLVELVRSGIIERTRAGTWNGQTGMAAEYRYIGTGEGQS